MNPEERVACLGDFLFSLAGLCRRTGENARAAALCDEAVEQARNLAATGSPRSSPLLAGNLERLAVFLIREGRGDEAAAPLNEAVDLFRRLAGSSPEEYSPHLAGALLTRGELFMRMELAAEALESFREAAAAFGRLAEKDAYAFTGKHLTSLCRAGFAAGRLGLRDVVNENYAKALQIENRFIRRYGLMFAPFVEDSFEKLR
jgi:tetratricopeptide (TPR) repeat protein